MKLFEVKEALNGLENVAFRLENGQEVPKHFHITEVGLISKNFMDCGGTVRSEQMVNFQLWSSYDVYHRLKPEKLQQIIDLSKKMLSIDDNLDVEVEYQSETIGKYALDFDGKNFVLQSKNTACLASDQCGIDAVVTSIKTQIQSCCSPSGGCC